VENIYSVPAREPNQSPLLARLDGVWKVREKGQSYRSSRFKNFQHLLMGLRYTNESIADLGIHDRERIKPRGGFDRLGCLYMREADRRTVFEFSEREQKTVWGKG